MAEKTKLSEKMWEQAVDWVDQIGVVVNEMAKQMGVAAEHIYKVYTKQMFVEGIVHSFVHLLSFAIFFVIWRIVYVQVCKTYNNPEDRSKYDPEAKIFVIVIGGIIFLLGFFLSIELLVESLLKIFNPEYYTLKDILESIKEIAK